MKKMMFHVRDETFNNLVQLNVEDFYNRLSDDKKKEIKDLFKCGTLLKETPEYQYLERVLKILTKCNANLHSTIVRERIDLQENIIKVMEM